MDLRHGPLPVVVAPHGMTLGGGVEVACTARSRRRRELYMGLVEIGVGLLPAGGGLKEMCRRASEWAAQVPGGDPYPFVRRAFEHAAAGKVSGSAHEARAMGFLRPATASCSTAPACSPRPSAARSASPRPATSRPIATPRSQVIGAWPQGASLNMGAQMFAWGGYASAHDQKIAQKIAHVLGGGMGKPRRDRPAPPRPRARGLLQPRRRAPHRRPHRAHARPQAAAQLIRAQRNCPP
jgi:3-hydroxyacyl-CoA dehydrogenase